MNWDKVAVLVQPKAGDKAAVEFAVSHHGKVVGNQYVSAKITNIVKHVGTMQSTRGDAHADVNNRIKMMNLSSMALKRSLAKVSKGFGTVMLSLGHALCNPALLYNLHTHVRMGSVVMDKLSNKMCALYRSCLGFKATQDQFGVWSRKSNTEVYLCARQLEVPHKLSITRLKVVSQSASVCSTCPAIPAR